MSATGDDTHAPAGAAVAADRTVSSPPGVRLPTSVRLLVTASALAFAGTFVAERIDYGRRHVAGISGPRYWSPQLLAIWLPGLGLTIAFAVAAWLVLRARRRGA